MMKRQPRSQSQFFYACLNVDERIRKDQLLRKVADRLDFDFACDDVKDLYGTNGNPSIPPPVLLKLMLLLVLKPYGPDRKNRYRLYAATTAVCASCTLRPQCTGNKRGRRVMRRIRQAELDQKRAEAGSGAAKRNGRIRHHLMERSFARAKRYCYDRARWRRLWRIEIQELLVCITQNLHVLVRKDRPMLAEGSAQALRAVHGSHAPFGGVAAWLTRLRHDMGRLLLSRFNRAPA